MKTVNFSNLTSADRLPPADRQYWGRVQQENLREKNNNGWVEHFYITYKMSGKMPADLISAYLCTT
jgi:hypothetical protein